jgi:hypothetical protein
MELRAQEKLLESLCRAQEHACSGCIEDVIVSNEPSMLGASTQQMRNTCQQLLGPSFERAYLHCKEKYSSESADMAAVHKELLDMVQLSGPSDKAAAVQQLEMLVFHEMYLI